jgi:hypothetical protein
LVNDRISRQRDSTSQPSAHGHSTRPVNTALTAGLLERERCKPAGALTDDAPGNQSARPGLRSLWWARLGLNQRPLWRQRIQRRRQKSGYPPPEFRGHKQATARPVSQGRSPEQMTSPRGLLRSAPAALLRGFPVMTRLAGRCPVGLVPEQPRISPMGHDVVDHGRRHHVSQGPARCTQRVLHQEGGPGLAPARTVAPARSTRTLAIQVALHLRRAAHPDRTVHGRLHGQRRLHKSKTRRGSPGGLIFVHGGTGDARTSSQVILFLAQNRPRCSVV